MVITGIRGIFPCAHGEQIEAIGTFWGAMRALYPAARLLGVGYGWENDALRYLIGVEGEALEVAAFALRESCPAAVKATLTLPEDGWREYRCATADIGATYDLIYQDGPLDYEIEEPLPGDEWVLRVHRA